MINIEQTDQGIVMTFAPPEALVLFGLLTRYDETSELQVCDQAEQLILWRLFGTLKPRLQTWLEPDVPQSIKLACETVRRLS